MRQNKHYAAKWTLPNLLANLTRREKCYEKHSASGEGTQIPIAFRGIGVALGGQRGHAPQIFRKYKHFVL